ncbi:MAG TPA: GNAT family N-acetyltransferase, partial [Thermoanaerobaculia bacterium]|nr:GNAT family N-acetyltransferase [Thermoanaerobaculia bacterium]
ELSIHLLQATDVPVLVAGFEAVGWSKPRDQFERYLAEQSEGARTVLVARLGEHLCGYGTIRWRSGYPPFREEGIPEIMDLNVLPGFQRQGIASRLLVEAERRVAERSGVVGIGVGLFTDYGPAQRLYVKRGYVPDGRGIVWRNQVVHGGQSVVADDSLVLHLTKQLHA